MFASTVVVLYLCRMIYDEQCYVIKVYGTPNKCIVAADILKPKTPKKISLADGKSWLKCKVEDYEP